MAHIHNSCLAQNITVSPLIANDTFVPTIHSIHAHINKALCSVGTANLIKQMDISLATFIGVVVDSNFYTSV